MLIKEKTLKKPLFRFYHANGTTKLCESEESLQYAGEMLMSEKNLWQPSKMAKDNYKKS